MALRKPPLRSVHAERGASFTAFGGWNMPVEFDSIRSEHAAVRESAGIFDVSHMGQIEVSGPDATRLTDRLVTADVDAMAPGEAEYACIVDEDGVIHDDTMVYRLPEAADAAFLFVPNAGHDEWAHGRWVDYRDAEGLDATVRNATTEWAMVAVQGPDSPDAVAAVADEEGIRDLPAFEVDRFAVAGTDALVARTGYTGEDGFELLCPVEDAEALWRTFDVQPCGLGARDTLRLEMGFLLSGQEFDPESDPRTPYEAGVGFAVDLDSEFVGRDALAAATDPDERLVGLVLQERGVPRNGYDVVGDDGHVVGTVTSGTMSPTLGEPIALGYLPVDMTDPGTTVHVVVRGNHKRATVAEPPFLDR